MGDRRRASFAGLALFAGLAAFSPAKVSAASGYEPERRRGCLPDRTSFRLSSNAPFLWKGIALGIADWRIKTPKAKKGEKTPPLLQVGIFPTDVKTGIIQVSSNVAGLKGKFDVHSGVIYPVDDVFCPGRRVGLLCNQMTLYETEQTLSMQCQLYIVGTDGVFDP